MNQKILVATVSNNNMEFIKKTIHEVDNIDYADLIIIDDGSEYDIIEELAEYKSVKCIKHEQAIGYGSCLTAAINYGRDFEYDYLISIDSESRGVENDIDSIIKNLDYGYDLVTCSRILENYEIDKIDKEILTLYEEISDYLEEITGTDITDPLSPNKGYNLKSIEQIDLTDNSRGILLQLFIQAFYYGHSILEIPSETGSVPGGELIDFENPAETLFSIMETERYLYSKGSIN